MLQSEPVAVHTALVDVHCLRSAGWHGSGAAGAPPRHSLESKSREAVRAAVGSLHYSSTWRTGLAWG